jgi:ubiquitin-small subunit ribosomal protein S27Ae
MAPAKAAPKGKEKTKKPYIINKIYDGGIAKNKSCPKCGPGTFLGEHKDRRTCGKCGYSERK